MVPGLMEWTRVSPVLERDLLELFPSFDVLTWVMLAVSANGGDLMGAADREQKTWSRRYGVRCADAPMLVL